MTSQRRMPLTVGVMATSSEPDERRIALHPDHLSRIRDELRASLSLESGYAADFGLTNDRLREVVGGVLDGPSWCSGATSSCSPSPSPCSGRWPSCATARCSGGTRTVCRTPS